MQKDEDRSLGYLISDAARLMRTVFDRRVRRLGLTRAQWLVLARLHRHPGASQSELADMMEVEKASAGRMLDRLERKGWVERRADPVDRRINRLYLTPDAERISQRMQAVADQTVGDALSDLTISQAEQLADLLSTVKARLVTLAAMPEPVDHAQGSHARISSDAARRNGSRGHTRLSTPPRDKPESQTEMHGTMNGRERERIEPADASSIRPGRGVIAARSAS